MTYMTLSLRCGSDIAKWTDVDPKLTFRFDVSRNVDNLLLGIPRTQKNA